MKPLPMPELQAFATNVWIADGPNVRDFGVLFTTRMVVVKLNDGSVWVNSPVPVPFDTLKRITTLGPVRYLVAATPRHVWRLEGWHTLFPQAQLWAPRTTLFTLKKGRLPFTGTLSDAPYSQCSVQTRGRCISAWRRPARHQAVLYESRSRTTIA